MAKPRHEDSYEMHCGLAEMYIADPRFDIADPRFARNYDRAQDGLAVFVHDAILANGQRSPATER